MSRAPDADGWVSLSDVQWMNIVNHEHAYYDYSKDDAVHAAVKATEAKLREINVAAAPAAVVQAEPSELTEQAIAAAVRDWFPDRANQAEYFARAVVTGQPHWTKRHLDPSSGMTEGEPV